MGIAFRREPEFFPRRDRHVRRLLSFRCCFRRMLECMEEGRSRRIRSCRLCDQRDDNGRYDMADVGCMILAKIPEFHDMNHSIPAELKD